MRLIDADALQREYMQFHDGKRSVLVDVAPTIEPKRKKGKWIDEGQYAEGHSEHAYYCSQCEEHYIGWIGEFNFCPNCGVDMRGDK